MTQRKTEPDLSKVPDGKVVAVMLLDTAWRVALPIIVLSIFGHELDLHLKTNPRYLLIGFFVSLVVAIVMVYRQLVATFPDQFGKNKIKEPITKKGDKK